jgi:hypothetical protein
MIDAGQHDAAGMTSKPVYATLCEAASATSQAPLLRVRAALVKDHTDQVPDKSFAADLKRKLALRKVMHPDDDQKHEQDMPPEGLKFLKEDVNYRYANDPRRSCGECIHFRSGSCEIVSGLIRSVDVCDKFEAPERGRAIVAVLVDTNEVTPPGYEKVVRGLKKAGRVTNPWAVAWWMKGQGIRPKSSEGGAGSGRRPSRSKFAPSSHEPEEPVRVETPKQRAVRMQQKKVPADRAAVIRKALGSAVESVVVSIKR